MHVNKALCSLPMCSGIGVVGVCSVALTMPGVVCTSGALHVIVCAPAAQLHDDCVRALIARCHIIARHY